MQTNNPELAKALVEFRKAFKQPKKDANNPFFKSKYVSLDAVVEAIDGVLPSCGLTYVQMPMYEGGKFMLNTVIMHTSGEWISGTYPIPENGKSQELGSAITYARRYSLCAAFGVVADEDDDGNAHQKPEGARALAGTKSGHMDEEFKNNAWEQYFEQVKGMLVGMETVDAMRSYWEKNSKAISKLKPAQITELNNIKDNKKKYLEGSNGIQH